MRPVGLYGRKHALIPAGLRDLTYYAAGPLPTAPASVAVPTVPNPGDGTEWGMLGNDTKGDCGIAGLEHGFMADSSILGVKNPSFPTAAQALNYYATYDKGQDIGVVLSQYLAYVKDQFQGYYGEQVAAYAPVNVQDINTLHFTIDAYGFAYTGIAVYRQMEADFGNGQPWTLNSITGGIAGGHCIPIVGYDSNYLYAITWGGVQPIAYPAWARIASEAWAVITRTQVQAGNDGRGINLAALKSDLALLAA